MHIGRFTTSSSSRLLIVGLLAATVIPALALFAWLQAQVNVAPSPPELGAPAPAVDLALLYGGDASLAEQRGNVVVMHFWATWCAPCTDEMPALQQVADDLHLEPFTLFEVNLGEDAAAIDPLRQQLGLRTPILLDIQGDVTQRYGVRALPATFVVDQQGNLRQEHLGPLVAGDAQTEWSAAWVEQQARALLPPQPCGVPPSGCSARSLGPAEYQAGPDKQSWSKTFGGRWPMFFDSRWNGRIQAALLVIGMMVMAIAGSAGGRWH